MTKMSEAYWCYAYTCRSASRILPGTFIFNTLGQEQSFEQLSLLQQTLQKTSGENQRSKLHQHFNNFETNTPRTEAITLTEWRL